jgi:uncharacterized membrane protein
MVRQILQAADSQPSWGRWFRQCLYVPWRTRQYFSAASLAQIEQAVSAAEQGHQGEIRVVIEGALPLYSAYRMGARQRARELFGLLRVWDTEHNTGLMLYLNLCERHVEIVADRGIDGMAGGAYWQSICEQMTQRLAAGQHTEAVLHGVEQLGRALKRFYDQVDAEGNELPNAPVVLR